jgi:GT2 family glycosyltransferase
MSRIAVLIPVFNQQDDLLRTLRSIDQQSAPVDCFIIDDGSEPPILVDAADYRFSIRLVRSPRNLGCPGACNLGMEFIVEGDYDYVARQDAGDLDVGERLAVQAAYLDKHPDVAVVGGWAQYVDRAGRYLYLYRAPADTKAIRARMPYGSAFANPATMIRVAAFERVGRYDERYRVSSDYELFFRLTKHFETANLQEVLILKEDNPNNLSIGQRRRSLMFRLRAQFQHFAWQCLRSYFGVLQTLVSLLLPYRLIVAVKNMRGYAK